VKQAILGPVTICEKTVQCNTVQRNSMLTWRLYSHFAFKKFRVWVLLDVFMVFLAPSSWNLRQHLKIGNGHFLPYGFYLFINVPLQAVTAVFIIIKFRVQNLFPLSAFINSEDGSNAKAYPNVI
jgi:hypothetical protein